MKASDLSLNLWLAIEIAAAPFLGGCVLSREWNRHGKEMPPIEDTSFEAAAPKENMYHFVEALYKEHGLPTGESARFYLSVGMMNHGTTKEEMRERVKGMVDARAKEQEQETRKKQLRQSLQGVIGYLQTKDAAMLLPKEDDGWETLLPGREEEHYKGLVSMVDRYLGSDKVVGDEVIDSLQNLTRALPAYDSSPTDALRAQIQQSMSVLEQGLQ